MITPVELEARSFKSGLGYDKKEVDQFVQEIAHDYEKMYEEHIELKDKMAMLSESLQHYKSIESNLQKALILAEKVAEETKINAEHAAKNIEKEAKNKAKSIVAEAKNDLEKIYSQTVEMVQNYDLVKIQFKQLLKTQLELLDSKSYYLNTEIMEAFRETSIKETTIPTVEEKVKETSVQLDLLKKANDKLEQIHSTADSAPAPTVDTAHQYQDAASEVSVSAEFKENKPLEENKANHADDGAQERNYTINASAFFAGLDE